MIDPNRPCQETGNTAAVHEWVPADQASDGPGHGETCARPVGDPIHFTQPAVPPHGVGYRLATGQDVPLQELRNYVWWDVPPNFGGESIGYGDSPDATATVNVVTGRLHISVPGATDTDIATVADVTMPTVAELEPWGAEEEDYGRADAALADMGWTRTGGWVAAGPDELATATVVRRP